MSMQRSLPRGAYTVLGLALAGALALTGCDAMIERQIERTLSRVDDSMLQSPDLQVILCGTGSPLPDPDRAAACTAVLVGGELWLIDAGPGSWETLDLTNVPTRALTGVLLTHFHSDHIGDLGEAVTQSWIAGRKTPLEVYGPPGVQRIVDGLAMVYANDVEARHAHHGEEAMPLEGSRAIAREIALPAAGEGTLIVDRNGLRITMFAVDHEPVVPAVGYRVDWKGRSVVISGDTKKSATIAKQAKDADLLIHEALDADAIARARGVAGRTGRTRLAKLTGDIPTYHASPVEAAQTAREANVKKLVFTHMVPGPANVIIRRHFLQGVSDAFAGEVVLGEDGMKFSLPPKS